MNTRTFLRAAVCACILTASAATVNQTAWAQSAATLENPVQSQAQTVLTIREVYDLLEKQGYRNFTEIELERERGRDDAYEVKADNASGDAVKLHVDAYNGNVLAERAQRGRDRAERRDRSDRRDRADRRDRSERRRRSDR